MSNQISDPYVEKLLAENPKLEKQFYQHFLQTNQKSILEKFANTPAWAIKEIYDTQSEDYMKSSLVSHVNFDLEELNKIINSTNSSLHSAATHSPHITPVQLEKIAASEDSIASTWAKYYLAKAANSLEEFITNQLNLPPENRDFTLRLAIQEVSPSDKLITRLIKLSNEIALGGYSQVIGDYLILNQNLSPENRVLLQLSGLIRKEVEIDYSRYPSTEFIIDATENDLNFQNPITKLFFGFGHPLGLVDSRAAMVKTISSEIDLSQLIGSEYLHRMFWRELSEEIEDFTLNFHNGYRVQDLFVNHPTISQEFDACEYDDGWKLGGVIPGYEDRDWVEKDEYLDDDRIESLLTNYAEDLSELAAEQEEFSELQPRTLAYLKFTDSGKEFCEEFGFELTEKAEYQIQQAAYDYAESDDYDIEVAVNSNFDEFLTWRNLPAKNQQLLFDSLLFGLSCSSPRLRRDSEHFLACIALHPATPTPLIDAMLKLDSKVIQATLALR